MEIILSSYCSNLTGSLSKKSGYSIQQQGGRFISKRNSRGIVPPDGHWRFIMDCVEMSRDGFFISDIRISGAELAEAAQEAGYRLDGVEPDKNYHARDVHAIQTRMSL